MHVVSKSLVSDCLLAARRNDSILVGRLEPINKHPPFRSFRNEFRCTRLLKLSLRCDVVNDVDNKNRSASKNEFVPVSIRGVAKIARKRKCLFTNIFVFELFSELLLYLYLVQRTESAPQHLINHVHLFDQLGARS